MDLVELVTATSSAAMVPSTLPLPYWMESGVEVSVNVEVGVYLLFEGHEVQLFRGTQRYVEPVS